MGCTLINSLPGLQTLRKLGLQDKELEKKYFYLFEKQPGS